VDGLRRSAISRRQVVGAILLDGQWLSPDMEARIGGRAADDFARLEAEVLRPEELALRVFGGLLSALGALGPKARAAARGIRAGAPPKPLVQGVVEDLAFLTGAYQDGARLLLGLGRVPASGGEGAAGLEAVLVEILSALSAGDAVRVGDALEHEFAPALLGLASEVERWRELVEPGQGAAPREPEPAAERGAEQARAESAGEA
jgi:hypothetical protein